MGCRRSLILLKRDVLWEQSVELIFFLNIFHNKHFFVKLLSIFQLQLCITSQSLLNNAVNFSFSIIANAFFYTLTTLLVCSFPEKKIFARWDLNVCIYTKIFVNKIVKKSISNFLTSTNIKTCLKTILVFHLIAI